MNFFQTALYHIREDILLCSQQWGSFFLNLALFTGAFALCWASCSSSAKHHFGLSVNRDTSQVVQSF
jgi:hypothetical protein